VRAEIAAHLSGVRNDKKRGMLARIHFPGHCEEHSDEAILVGVNEIARSRQVGARNDKEVRAFGNDNITVPPPIRAEVQGKAQFKSQLPTSHCL
jgi:hypothetical protein